ncbi:Ig domain-containing protein [Hyalangium gracile]|uniref:Ig domain-containing protein n=1 Tax=Hyalangium gracile TaxID=394092 RepID=UPI001CCFCE6C|nr:Ig domain-containing protein [Hyalangium gracile]
MNSRLAMLGLGLLCAAGLVSSCRFDPDLNRFATCAENDMCAPGFTCLKEAGRCLPDCGALGPCPIEEPPLPLPDAGPDEDGGVDGGVDGGTDSGVDAGTDGGVDAGPLTLVTAKLPLGVEDIPYSAPLEVRGGTPPYQFRSTKELPAWLSFDGGVLSGKPLQVGTYSVAVEVSDSSDPSVQRSATYDVRVRPQLRVAGPGTLVDGYQNTAYIETITATGGIGNYSFSIAGGNSHPDLRLGNTGNVTGTPGPTGTYVFRVQVKDSDPEEPQVVERELKLAIKSPPLVLTTVVSTQSLPDGRVGTPYEYVLRTNPSANGTWTIKEGALPGGIRLDANPPTLSGTPNERGTFPVKFQVTEGLLLNVEVPLEIRVY